MASEIVNKYLVREYKQQQKFELGEKQLNGTFQDLKSMVWKPKAELVDASANKCIKVKLHV